MMLCDDNAADDDGHHDVNDQSSESLSLASTSGSDVESDLDDYSDEPWSESIGKKGDLFFVEPSQGPITSISVNKQPSPIAPDNPDKGWKGNLKKQFRRTLPDRFKNGVTIKNGSISGSMHGVRFQDKTGVQKDVFLCVDPERHNYGRRASLTETLFGIIPGKFTSKSILDERIMIQGLTPEGEALRSREIKIGDWLMCINDLEVDFGNIDSILTAIQSPRKIKLTLQRFAQEAYITQPVVRRCQDSENLVKFVNGQEVLEISEILKMIPHAALYLTLDSDDERDNQIAYQYPSRDTAISSLCGLYISLTQMLAEATNSPATSSTLYCNGRLVHIGHCSFGKDVLVLIAPADKVPSFKLRHILAHITRLLEVFFGTVSTAFKSSENIDRLDHFFALLFQQLLLQDELTKQGIPVDNPQKNFLDIVDETQWLTLPESSGNEINNVLSDLESSDFGDMSDDYYGIRRRYTILGSCLYHKGYLIASHLSSDDLVDVSLYVRYYCLLALSRHKFMSQLIVWREIFLSSIKKYTPVAGYNLPESRKFLLLVGMKHSLLCVLLEAGGCAETAVGNPPPDPFYVDQAKATLLHLQSIDLSGMVDQKLKEAPTPCLANPEGFFPNAKIAKAESLTQLEKTGTAVVTIPTSPVRKVNPPESILKKRGSPNSSQRRGSVSGGSVGDRESDAESLQSVGSASNPVLVRNQSQRSSAGSTESVASGTSGTLFRNQKQGRNLPSIYDLNGVKISADENAPEIQLANGAENILFHYIQINCDQGTLLCPLNIYSANRLLHKKIIENFCACCQRIKKVFDRVKEDFTSKKKYIPLDEVKSSLGSIHEEGVLFECEPEQWTDTKRTPPKMSYWVVGRMVMSTDPQQVYLCFHESIPQNIVELMFQLKFGTYL